MIALEEANGMSSFKTLFVEKKNKYALVTMNRPREMNALSRLMRDELDHSFALLAEDDSVSVVILTGGSYVFSAGMDIKEMAALGDGEIDDYFKSISRCLKRVGTFKKPVIAAVGGIALGGGFNLAVVCDLIVASESAIFSHPELRFGLNPLFGPLNNLVGMAKAKEITMLGEPVGANEALRIGLINKVAPPDRLASMAETMAIELSQRSESALEAVKRISRVVPRLDREAALDLEFDISALLFGRSERKEHMREFMDDLNRRKKR